ncbi:uncharacterized protein RBU57_007446 isoform 1-T2 [Macrochelys suwanniensis]
MSLSPDQLDAVSLMALPSWLRTSELRQLDPLARTALNAASCYTGDQASVQKDQDWKSTKLDNTFLGDPETLDSIASESEGESGPTWVCSIPRKLVQEDTVFEEDDGYMDLREKLFENCEDCAIDAPGQRLCEMNIRGWTLQAPGPVC